jgi:alanine racemase
MRDSGEERPVWAWVDRDAVRHNARRAIDCAQGRTVIGVVKADGYGHGAVEIARALLAEGVSRLAAVSVAEGAELRRSGIVVPILLLGGLEDAASAERALKWGLTPVLHDQRGFELARSLASSASPLSVEVEIDTGMHRMGVLASQAVGLLEQITKTPQLLLSGLFTHLACADERDPETSRDQIAAFGKIRHELPLPADDVGSARLETHVANSAGLLRLAELETGAPGLVTSAVRPGLMLYGVSPFVDRSAESLDLDPVMTLAARVVALRNVAKGEGVGYGATWRATTETSIATLPLGYADGLPRSLAGRGKVFLAGAMRRIVGRVSMDYVTVEVAGASVEIGQVATIFGRTSAGTRVPVEDLADAAGTIGYEILVGIGTRVPRVLGNGLPPAMDPGPRDSAV